jgi:PDZ domain-containing secreted protein
VSGICKFLSRQLATSPENTLVVGSKVLAVLGNTNTGEAIHFGDVSGQANAPYHAQVASSFVGKIKSGDHITCIDHTYIANTMRQIATLNMTEDYEEVITHCRGNDDRTIFDTYNLLLVLLGAVVVVAIRNS